MQIGDDQIWCHILILIIVINDLLDIASSASSFESAAYWFAIPSTFVRRHSHFVARRIARARRSADRLGFGFVVVGHVVADISFAVRIGHGASSNGRDDES